MLLLAGRPIGDSEPDDVEPQPRQVVHYQHEGFPWDEPDTSTRATPHFYRRSTPLVEELDALTGYDSGGLYAAYEAAIQARHAAKLEISRLSALAVSLRARFEAKGTMPSQAEHERSQRLAELSEDIRTQYYRNPETEEVPAKRKGEEPTSRIVRLSNEEVGQRARAHPDYKRFLTAQGDQRREYEDVKRRLDEAWAEYELQAGIAEYLGSQLEDRKSMIYYASKEWRHRDASSGA